MAHWWEKQIKRADELAALSCSSRELLVFYSQLLRAQKDIYESLSSRKDWLPSGELQTDLPTIRGAWPIFLKSVETYGPDSLAAEARDLSAMKADDIDEMLLSHWLMPSDIQFFPKAFLQPYARWLAETGAVPIGRELRGGERLCPFCGGNP